jgi:hypothetical protein
VIEPQPKQDEPSDASSLEWGRLRFERQKLALELQLKRRELAQGRHRGILRDLLANPLSVAIVGGVLTLLTSIVTGFLTAQASREAAHQTLQADLIKKFVEAPRPEDVRENLRFLADSGLIPDYRASIQGYLAANPYSAPQVGSGLDFSRQGEAVSLAVQDRLREAIERYRTFLQLKGFDDLDEKISIFVYSKDAPVPAAEGIPSDIPNSFYHNNTLYIHRTLSEDLSIALREFTHFALSQQITAAGFKQTAVESALADYFPATFLNSPSIGVAFNKTSNSGFRTLDNKRPYDAEATKGEEGWFPRGIVWASALWACRNPKQPQNVDDLLLPAWRKVSVPPFEEDLVEARFGAALDSTGSPTGDCLRQQLSTRRLPSQK